MLHSNNYLILPDAKVEWLDGWILSEKSWWKYQKIQNPNALIDIEKAMLRGTWLVQCGSPFPRKMQL